MTVTSFPLAAGLEAAYDDVEARRVFGSYMAASGGVAAYSGVRPSGSLTDLLVTANGTPNNTVFVSAGVLHHRSGGGGGAGTYITVNDANASLTVPAADATLLRKDAVFVDPDAVTAVDRLIYVQGTPGGGSYPSLTGNRWRLANVDCRSLAVAGGTVIRPADIFPTLSYTAAMGGRILCQSASRPATPHVGLEIWEIDTGRLLTWDGTVWGSTGRIQTVTSLTRPASPTNGQEIFETDTGLKRLWRSDQTKWQCVGGDYPSAKFKTTSDKAVSHNTYTVVSWDGVDYDDPGGATLNFYAVGTPTRIRIPVSGIYFVNAFIQWQINGSDSVREIELRKNSGGSSSGGTFLSRDNDRPNISGGPHRTTTMRQLALTAGDYLELFVYQLTGGSLNVWAGSENTGLEITFLRDLP